MNNDLISRSELISDLETYFKSGVEGIDPTTLFKQILLDIKNAPTVEQRDNFDLGYIQGLEDGKNERPQANDLCETCKKVDSCEDSTKEFSNWKTTRCYKYEEADNES